MPYTNVWSDTLPNGTEDANTIDSLITKVKVDLQDRLKDIWGITDFTADPLRPFVSKMYDNGTVAAAKTNWEVRVKNGITRLWRDPSNVHSVDDTDAATIVEGEHFVFMHHGLLELNGAWAGIEMTDHTTFTKRFWQNVVNEKLTFGRVEKNGSGFYGGGGNVANSVKNWLTVSFSTQEASFTRDVILETGMIKTDAEPYAKFGIAISGNPIADNGTIIAGAYGSGGMLVVVADVSAIFVIDPTPHTANLVDSATFGGLFSNTKDTSGKINVYQESGVGLVIQNKRGSSINIGYFFTGIG